MRIKGEVVTLLMEAGGGVDADGYPIPAITKRVPIKGCVVAPRGASIQQDGLVQLWDHNELTVFFPTFVSIGGVKVLELRGERFNVDGPSFEHRSPFGTSLGGTQVNVTKVSATT